MSASTQNQAKSAILFLYKEVLGEALPWLEGIESAKRPERLPVVLTRQEVESILAHLSGTVGWMIRLLYGTGTRIMECVRLRVKDVDFARGEIVVRQGKGGTDRMTMLPQSLAVLLKDHLVSARCGARGQGAEARTGVLVIDLRTESTSNWVRSSGVVTELYDVVALPAVVHPTSARFSPPRAATASEIPPSPWPLASLRGPLRS